MKSKELIISLIQQDLKHTQLVAGLDKVGLEASDKHHLQILELIAKIMQVPEGDVDDNWGQVYFNLVQEAKNFTITDTADSLRPYAEVCFEQLRVLLKIEKCKAELSI